MIFYMQKNKTILLLFLLIFLSACIQNNNSFNCENGKTYFVSRIIDGDTIEAENKKIRLNGINTPEKKEACFNKAKEFLEKEILEKKVLIKEKGTDKYGRIIGSVCVNGKSVNKELIKQGLAHYAFTESEELKKIQEKAIKENKGCLWKKGTDKYIQEKCIKLKKLEFNQKNFNGEFVEFSNDCNYSIDLNGFYLKDEATHLYFFPAIELKGKSFVRVFSEKGINSGNELYWGKGNIWNNDSDQLFLRNEKGFLIVYFEYNNTLN